MKIKNLKLFVLSLLTIGFLSGCDSESSTQTSSRVQLKLVDAPGDYEQVNVEIIDVVYNTDADAEWKSFTSFSGPKNVDLTTLIAGNTMLLSDEVIEEDDINEIRLILGSNNTLLLEGQTSTIPLTTPSAQQSGLKLKLDQELEAGFTYSYILDWNVQESVVDRGNGEYNLKPVIRVITEANSGSVSGEVVDDKSTSESNDDEPIEDAVVSIFSTNDVLVAETFTNAEGKFTFQGLPAGTYIIKVAKDSFVDFTLSSNVTVTVGETANLDTIFLVKI